MNRLNKYIWAVLFLSMIPAAVFGQAFGKNKVQYDEHDWVYLRSQHFDIYFYEGGKYIADFAADVLEEYLDYFQRTFDYDIRKRVPIMIYKSHNDFQQTNVVMPYMEEGIGGVTESLKNRVVVPFDGSYEQFRHVLAHELVHAYMNDMIYGASVQSIVSGAVRLRLPLWYAEGMAEYMSLHWTTRADMILRDGTIHGYLGRISPYQLGQALMKHIGDKYGEEKVSDILRRINITKDIERGFVSALGMDLEDLFENFELSMRRRYWPDITDRKNPDEFSTRMTEHLEDGSFINAGPAVSPNGDKIAYISNKSGHMDVFLISAINGEKIGKIIDGQQSHDLEELKWLTPGMTWSPDGQNIALSVKAGDQDALTIVNVNTRNKTQFKFGLDGLFDADWSPDGDKIAFVGTKNGTVDIYSYNLKTEELQQVTDDYFTDRAPSWSPDGTKLLFTSDRKDFTGETYVLGDDEVQDSDTQPFDMYTHDYQFDDIFMVNADGSGMERLTFSDRYTEGTPIWSPDGKSIVYTSEESGISNIYIMNIETGESYPITNALTGIYQLSLSREGTKLAFVSYYQAGFDIFMIKNPFDQVEIEKPIEKTVYFKELEEKEKKLAESGMETGLADKMEDEGQRDRRDRDLSQYIFDDRARFVMEEIEREKDQFNLTDEDIKDEDGSYRVSKYKLKFTPDIVSGNYGYDTFFGVQGSSFLQFSDMLGNHTVMLGTDMYFDLRNSDYQLFYYYLPKKTDFAVGIYNYVNFFTQWVNAGGYALPAPLRLRNYGFNFMASRPFSKYKRVDFGLQLSQMSQEYLVSELEYANWKVQVLQASLGYTSDNTLWGFLGPIDGRRMNFTLSGSPPIGKREDRFSYVTMSGDYRKYYRINRNYSLAFRLSGGLSTGETPEAFFLGGVPNWLNRDFNGDIRTGLRDIFFGRWVTPLRGSDYYELVGNRYALLNAEMRYPFIRQMAFGWPLPLSIQNVLGAMFLDFGGAWTNDDFRWTTTEPNGDKPFRDVRMGYGFGARIYFGGFLLLRADVAWKYDNVMHSKPRYMLSLGGDW